MTLGLQCKTNEYIPKASETETHKVADFTGGAANTIYKVQKVL